MKGDPLDAEGDAARMSLYSEQLSGDRPVPSVYTMPQF